MYHTLADWLTPEQLADCTKNEYTVQVNYFAFRFTNTASMKLYIEQRQKATHTVGRACQRLYRLPALFFSLAQCINRPSNIYIRVPCRIHIDVVSIFTAIKTLAHRLSLLSYWIVRDRFENLAHTPTSKRETQGKVCVNLQLDDYPGRRGELYNGLQLHSHPVSWF